MNTTPSSASSGVRFANYESRRSLLKYILLGLITLGIYSIWLTARSGEDLNAIANHRDNQRSMSYWLICLIQLVAGWCLIGMIPWCIWWHKTSSRIGNELERRGLTRTVRAMDFWILNVLPSTLMTIGFFSLSEAIFIFSCADAFCVDETPMQIFLMITLFSVFALQVFFAPLFMHKWLKGMNQLCTDFNQHG